MGINMGVAKGPLPSSITTGSPGDSTLKLDLTYRTTPTQSPKRYGLPTRIASTINGAANPKSYKDLYYYYETHSGYFDRYILSAVQSETDSAYDGTVLKRAVTAFFEEAGKWGATTQVQRFKTWPSTYYSWDYSYSQSDASHINISIDPPGTEEQTGVQYLYGVPAAIIGPYFTKMTRTVSPDSSFVLTETNQSGGVTAFTYDDLGRVLTASPESPRNPVNCDWQQGRAVITQGQNTVTRYWDGMGRDLGYTESGDGTTLYSLKTLDAEGRVKRESKGSVRVQPDDHIPEYSYELDASGRPLSITDPLNMTTHITYSGTSTTIADPENHATTLAYADFPGSPTTVTDALNHAAVYAYDAVGRLRTVVFNGSRTQSYEYDGLDNLTSESHPETSAISYVYNNENRLSQKTWGGITETYTYNTSGQLTTFSGTEQVTYHHDDKGRIDLVSGGGWSRHRDYNIWGSVTSETQSIPGLGSKAVAYGYDGNNILNQVTYPDGRIAQITNNGLGRPETLSFYAPSAKTLISGISYGPGKQIAAATIAGNNTALAATYYNNGALNTASLVRGGTALFSSSYEYDRAGNITGISSTAPTPTMSAVFGYDALNRLTSAAYTSGRVASFAYSYDAYGNMLSVQENGVTVPGFPKTYLSSNQVQGNGYDARGNLTSADGRSFYWDAQNRLIYLADISGQIVGDYRYDDRGLRLSALPPVSDIEVTGIATGGNIDMTSSLNTPVYKTLTIRNFGHANLTLSQATVGEQDASQFSVDQQPGSPVAPGGSTTLVVKFLPTSSGNKTALLSIPSNDPDENPYEITLSGYCEPIMDVLEIAPGETYDFGTIYVGEYAEATFTVKNFGSANLVLYGPPVTLSGPGSASFTVTQQATSPLAPNGTSAFTIRFAPNSQNLKIATVSITNNDPDLSPYTFTVSGTGERGLDKIIDEEAFSVTAPAGGEEWVAGSIQNIAWNGGKNAKAVKIEYSPDNGSTYFPIVERANNIGVYPWKVPVDLSQGCLVRVSDADGALAAPLIISYEFNFKISSLDEGSDVISAKKSAHFVFCAAVPDKEAQVYRVADVSFGPGEIAGAENLLFNQAMAEIPAEEAFLGVWHHACVRYDMRDYSGSVWIDDGPVMSGVPLVTQTLESSTAIGVALSKTRDVSIRLWVDDIEVRLIDQRDMPSHIEEGAFGRLFRDRFCRYESPSLLAEGGWLAVNGATSSDGSDDRTKKTADTGVDSRDVAGFRPLIDDRQFISKPRAMRLEPETDEPSRSIAKQVSFPVRVPFAVSPDSFSIVGSDVEAIAASVSGLKIEALKDDGRERTVTPGSRRSLTQEAREKPTGLSTLSGDNAGGTQPASGGAAKTMSAAPAGGSFYIYSFDGQLLAEYNLYGECVRDYIYMGAQLVAEYRPSPSQYLYYMGDQINSTRVVTDDTGTVVYSAAYDPYGGIQQTPVDSFDPALKFSGKERDGESGLDYFGARYYDMSQYRFVQADVPIDIAGACMNPQGWNAYGFCLDNPLSTPGPSGDLRNRGEVGPVSVHKQELPSQNSHPNSQYQNPYRPSERRPSWSSLLKPSRSDCYVIFLSFIGTISGQIRYLPAKPVLFSTYLNDVNYLLPASVNTYEPPDDLFGGSLSIDALFNTPQNASIDSVWDVLNRYNGGFPEVPNDSGGSVVIIVIFFI